MSITTFQATGSLPVGIYFATWQEGHWFSLIERGKSYWIKVREIKKPI